MSTVAAPIFRELGRSEIDALLARNNVGRMAYARGSHIDIEPLHYVYASGWLYGRTSPGRKDQLRWGGPGRPESTYDPAGEYTFQCDPHVALGMTGKMTVR